MAALAARLLAGVGYFLKSPWIKFEVNKSYMYIKYSNSKELSSQGKSCPKIIGMLIVKDTSALKNGDKAVTSSWIVKVKITKNVPKSFVTIVTVFV